MNSASIMVVASVVVCSFSGELDFFLVVHKIIFGSTGICSKIIGFVSAL